MCSRLLLEGRSLALDSLSGFQRATKFSKYYFGYSVWIFSLDILGILDSHHRIPIGSTCRSIASFGRLKTFLERSGFPFK